MIYTRKAPLICILASLILSTILTLPTFGEEPKTPFISKDLPDSLAHYYKGRRNQYALSMIELGRLMGASFEEAYSKNYDHAIKLFKSFEEQYDQVSQMVPEWDYYFPNGPLQEVEQLISQKAPPEKIRESARRVENICTNCHIYEMFKVQSTYHWKKFNQISIVNQDGEDISFHTIMIQLSNKLAVIPSTVQREDFEAAQRHFKDLSDNFIFLEMSCNRCHAQPREYFVDQRVKAHWYQIGGLIRHKKTDLAAYNKLVDQVYEQSCIPCHRVHMPVAFMQIYLSE
ncbi:MAG: hypothetical protein A3G93_10530 [Nitrospinae bacterium RIFCSPLOWO2_12_FULL_45_22]|nr:MAG: hypothetical protein A3G93_10530 [Nitrospinae bacterium RIFCSPLOWO2_12_FULL_45_22]